MSEITIKANNKFSESVGARSIFIDNIVNDAAIDLEFIFSGGEKELHKITSGSKFSSPDKIISELVFYNKNGVPVDVDFHYSRFLIYDEAKVIGDVSIVGDVTISGDVNSLTRFDNLSNDGNQFFSGTTLPAGVDVYSQMAVYNPVGSGIVTYVNLLRLNARGDNVEIRLIDEADSLLAWDGLGYGINKIAYGTDSKSQILISLFDTVKRGSGKAVVSTDLYGVPTEFNYGNAPIILNEGVGLLFVPANVNTSLTSLWDYWEA